VPTSEPANKAFEIVLRFDTSGSKSIRKALASDLVGEMVSAAREIFDRRGISFQAVEGSWQTGYVVSRGEIDNDELRERPRRGRGVVVETDED
jgi:hypothetical protein